MTKSRPKDILGRYPRGHEITMFISDSDVTSLGRNDLCYRRSSVQYVSQILTWQKDVAPEEHQLERRGTCTLETITARGQRHASARAYVAARPTN